MFSQNLKGHLDMMLLSVLRGAPAHGYAVVERLAEASEGAFELGEGLKDQQQGKTFWLSDAWNSMPVYVPDDSQPCLFAGATEKARR